MFTELKALEASINNKPHECETGLDSERKGDSFEILGPVLQHLKLPFSNGKQLVQCLPLFLHQEIVHLAPWEWHLQHETSVFN